VVVVVVVGVALRVMVGVEVGEVTVVPALLRHPTRLVD
jgi:hypothetical protein